LRAQVTVTADVNSLVLSRMVVENGLWLVRVHSRRIVKATRIPPEVPIEDFLQAETGDIGENPFLAENHSESG